MPLEDGIASSHRDALHDPARGGRDDVLHLHGVHHEQLLPLVYEIAFLHVDFHDRTLHRRLDGQAALRSFQVRRVLAARRRRAGPRLSVVEYRERIDGVDRRSGQGGPGRLIEEEPPMGAARRDEFRDVVRHETGVDTIRHDVGVLEQALQEGDVRGHTLDLELAERAIDPRHQIGETAPTASIRRAWPAANRSAGSPCSRRIRTSRPADRDPRAPRMP